MTEENNLTSEGAVEITHDVGLHARPSVKLTKLAKRFSARIEIAAEQLPVRQREVCEWRLTAEGAQLGAGDLEVQDDVHQERQPAWTPVRQ